MRADISLDIKNKKDPFILTTCLYLLNSWLIFLSWFSHCANFKPLFLLKC